MNPQQPQAITQALPAPASVPAISLPAARPVRLSLGAVTLVAAPITVLLTMIAGMGILALANLPIHPAEMAAGAIVNLLGGVLAALVLFVTIKHGATGIAQAGILGIGIRCGAVLLGMMLAGITLFGLDRTVLVYWVMGYYFPMMIVETALVAWLTNRLPA